jgi:hypothetical protein
LVDQPFAPVNAAISEEMAVGLALRGVRPRIPNANTDSWSWLDRSYANGTHLERTTVLTGSK